MGHYLEDLRLSVRRKQPESVEEFPEKYQQLVINYQALSFAQSKAIEELKDSTNFAQDGLLGALGERIKHRVLRFTNEAISNSNSNKLTPSANDYLPIGSTYWFLTNDQRLVVKKWDLKRNYLGVFVPDTEELVDAPNEAWYVNGMVIANKVLAHLTNNGRLPPYLKSIPVPA